MDNAAVARDDGVNSERSRRKQLEFLGVPPRLAKTVAEEDSKVGRRIFLLDNSGSTAHPDGKVFVEVQGQVQFRPCTRWEEVKQVALEHAKWNSLQGTPCEFVLLNGSGTAKAGVDFVTVEGNQTAAKAQIQSLEAMLAKTGPTGRTPLGARLREIGRRVEAHKQSLFAAGQRAYLVIVTDGLPDDSQEFTTELKNIMNTLPVQVVIRLCTDESNVVQYYNGVEEDIEMPLDVLDDPQGEAQELAKKGNGWFTYTLALHRIREGGTFVKILDLIDERILSNLEVVQFAQELLQEPEDQYLSTDPATFCAEVQGLLNDGATPVYNVRRNALTPPVDMALLRARMLPPPPPPPPPQCVQCIMRLVCCRRRALAQPLLPN